MKPRVWAPNRQQIELQIGGERREMIAAGGGWWEAREDYPPGTDYFFCVEGGAPLPDPRSAHQPAGVHGPSRLVDRKAFAWETNAWPTPPLAAAVLYELHVGTFTAEGTFDAAIARLPDLVELGITHIELLPVAAFPGRHGWGYDGVALYAPHEAYGGPLGLMRLVDACHKAGLCVLLDVVYNHLGPSGNYLSSFGPYFTERYATPWGEAVNLDGAHSDEVRRFFIDNALMWLEDYRIDGLRLDAVHAFDDKSATPFLEELSREVKSLEAAVGRPLALIAESDLNDPRLVHSLDAGGFGLEAHWCDDFHHALHAALTGERDGYYGDFGSLEVLATALKRGYVHAGDYSEFRERRHGRPPVGVRADQLVVCIQNHDQIGNRARGERISALTAPGRQKIAAALTLLGPFVPLLFQGEEWAAATPFQYFTDHDDPELQRAVREGRRRELRPLAGSPRRCPTRAHRRLSSAPSSTGASATRTAEGRCSAGTAPSSSFAGACAARPATSRAPTRSPSTRPPSGCASSGRASRSLFR